jgi:aryl-alcohol dehydrogenase-like predicted oxidoreductase
MEYRLLGSSGCAVSALALGSLTFGNETNQAASFSQLDRFTEAGGNLVDSADGRAEEIIRRWLAARPGRRELVVLATKGRFPTDESPNGHGLSRRHLSLALDASLRRLAVETIDLYQVHGWDPLTRLEETLRFLDDAVGAGKINYVGLSNFTAGSCRRQWISRSSAGFRARCPCSRSTTCWPARSNGRWCPPARPPGSACLPGHAHDPNGRLTPGSAE